MTQGSRDAYEADHMKAPGVVLHRDKNVARAAVLAMVPMGLIALLATIAVAAGADGAPPALAILPGLWFLWTLWMILTKVSVRTVVTSEALEVHWGLAGRTIPVSAITHCEVLPISGGHPYATMGMKMWGPKGWVLVRWRDDEGKDKAAQFPAADPAKLVEQIDRARAGTLTRVRVADDAAEEQLEEIEAASPDAETERASR